MIKEYVNKGKSVHPKLLVNYPISRVTGKSV
jgi:hypothetical protein